MTAWSAKVWRSAISSSVNPPGVAAGHRDRPDAPRRDGAAAPPALAPVATSTGVGALGIGQSGIGLGVGDIERRAIANGLGVPSPRIGATVGRPPSDGVAGVVGARERGELDLIARRSGSARPESAPSKRTALATIASNTGWTSVCERLMTRRMSLVAVCCSSAVGQLAVARLQLREQPHVLDRDDRLVGEGLEQRDLLVGEAAGLSARRTLIAPIGRALPQQRHASRTLR